MVGRLSEGLRQQVRLKLTVRIVLFRGVECPFSGKSQSFQYTQSERPSVFALISKIFVIKAHDGDVLNDKTIVHRGVIEKSPRCDNRLIRVEIFYNFRKKRLSRRFTKIIVEDSEENQGVWWSQAGSNRRPLQCHCFIFLNQSMRCVCAGGVKSCIFEAKQRNNAFAPSIR
tara:strand:+ start:908 stop:1420 length:513 start_codon:yes stop_codon:yes gene_type:complete